jgi:hypothetical protein
MLKVFPKSHTMSLPQANRVTESYIIFSVDFFSDETEADEVQEKIDKRISEIKSYVSMASDSIRSLNNHLETKARAAIDRRREQVEAANDIRDELGVDRDTDTPTGYVKPEKNGISTSRPPPMIGCLTTWCRTPRTGTSSRSSTSSASV